VVVEVEEAGEEAEARYLRVECQHLSLYLLVG
jgi:hypothetical protein